MGIELKADIILKGASFYCGKNINNNIDFIAIKGNRIISAGGNDGLSEYVGPGTQILSFSKENLVIPGLHDNHIHLIPAGILEKYVKLYSSSSKEDVARLVLDFSKKIPEEKWVMGVGFRRLSWDDTSYPTKEVLDALLPDRPVFLLDEELHAAWLNSMALDICGIDINTVPPDGGIINRDEHGEPTGFLLENAVSLAAKWALDFDAQTVRELVSCYTRNAVKMGITSVSDMAPYLSLDLSFPEVYFDMVKHGSLDIRVNAARNLFENIEDFCEIRQRANEEGYGFYRVPFMKQFVDGTPANYTGMLLSDYSDNLGEKGAPTIDIDRMEHAVEIATKNNVSVRLHSCGDGSCRAALDGYEKAIKKYPQNKCRHMVEHLEVVDPDDIPRFGQLGIIASIQPEHLASGTMLWEENSYPQRLGEARCRFTWPFNSIKNSGAVLAAGSDCPVVEGNPFWGMYVGNTRRYYDGKPEQGWNPQECLSMEDLINAYTLGAAYAEGREEDLGTLQAGKLADIIVVDRNLLLMAGDTSIRDTEVLLTIVDGKIVYSNL